MEEEEGVDGRSMEEVQVFIGVEREDYVVSLANKLRKKARKYNKKRSTLMNV